MEEKDKVIISTKDEFITIQQNTDVVYLTKEEAISVSLKLDQLVDKWININDAMPDRNVNVLVHTPFCSYKSSVAFWNGVDWRSADDKNEVWNISYWMPLPSLPTRPLNLQ